MYSWSDILLWMQLFYKYHETQKPVEKAENVNNVSSVSLNNLSSVVFLFSCFLNIDYIALPWLLITLFSSI